MSEKLTYLDALTVRITDLTQIRASENQKLAKQKIELAELVKIRNQSAGQAQKEEFSRLDQEMKNRFLYIQSLDKNIETQIALTKLCRRGEKRKLK